MRLQSNYKTCTLIIDGTIAVLHRKIQNLKIANQIRKAQYKTSDQLNEEGKFLTVFIKFM
jgi:hypothetical protein